VAIFRKTPHGDNGKICDVRFHPLH
jgi:hypothetical protein